MDNVPCQSSHLAIALGVLRGLLAPRVIGPPYTRTALALPVIGRAPTARYTNFMLTRSELVHSHAARVLGWSDSTTREPLRVVGKRGKV